MDEKTNLFLRTIWRAGQAGYFWSSAGKKTQWMAATEPVGCALGVSNVYFGVHPTLTQRNTHERGRIVDIAAINCLFSEYDAKDYGTPEAIRTHIKGLPIQPQVIVFSGGGYHAYWFLHEPVIMTDSIRDYMRGIQAAWVQLTGGDRGAHDLARVLRLPGTKNAKYTPPKPVTFARFDLGPDSPLYDINTLASAAEPLYDAPETITELPTTNAAIATGGGAIAGIVSKLGEATEGERNTMLHWCACRLFERGLSEAGVAAELLPTSERIGLRRSETLATIKSAGNQPARAPARTSAAQSGQLADIRMKIADAINGTH